MTLVVGALAGNTALTADEAYRPSGAQAILFMGRDRSLLDANRGLGRVKVKLELVNQY